MITIIHVTCWSLGGHCACVSLSGRTPNTERNALCFSNSKFVIQSRSAKVLNSGKGSCLTLSLNLSRQGKLRERKTKMFRRTLEKKKSCGTTSFFPSPTPSCQIAFIYAGLTSASHTLTAKKYRTLCTCTFLTRQSFRAGPSFVP